MHNFSKLYNFFSMSWNNTHFHTLIKKTECWILYRAFRISHQYSIESLRLCRYMIFVIECFKLWRFVRVSIFPFKIQLAKYVWFHLLRSFWDCTHQIKYVYTYKYIHTLSRYRHKRQTSVTCMSISLSYHDIRTSVFEPLSFLKNFSYSKNEQINAARAAAWIDTRSALRISILYSFPITKHEFWMSLRFSFLVDKTCFNMDF